MRKQKDYSFVRQGILRTGVVKAGWGNNGYRCGRGNTQFLTFENLEVIFNQLLWILLTTGEQVISTSPSLIPQLW